MSGLLEILGRAITIDSADLIWHWLNTVLQNKQDESARYQQITRIREFVDKRKIDSASEELRIYLFDNPSCIYGRLAAAAICLQENQLQRAIEELNSVYMRQPGNTMALYVLGHCYERLGKEAEAIEFYQDCLKFKNYLKLPHQRLAAIYFKNGQLEKTIRQYEELKNEYPDDMPTLITLGHLYISAGQYDRASNTFNTAILIHPDNFRAEEDHIDHMLKEGRAHEALEEVEHLMDEHPERLDLLVRAADILAIMGNAEEAIAAYRHALDACPGFLEATIKLGTLYMQIGESEPAAQQFNAAVEINDRIVDAYIGLAIAEKSANRVSEALTILSLASAIQANSSMLFAETAALQLKAAMDQDFIHSDTAVMDEDPFELVIAAHKRQLSRRQQNPDLHYRMGLLFMSRGKMEHAANMFENAVKINPLFSRARYKLAVSLFESHHKAKAIEQLMAQGNLDSETVDLHYKTAILYADKIKFASSLLNLEQFMQNNFASPEAAVNISVVLQNLGLLDRVASMWENLADTANEAMNL